MSGISQVPYFDSTVGPLQNIKPHHAYIVFLPIPFQTTFSVDVIQSVPDPLKAKDT